MDPPVSDGNHGLQGRMPVVHGESLFGSMECAAIVTPVGCQCRQRQQMPP